MANSLSRSIARLSLMCFASIALATSGQAQANPPAKPAPAGAPQPVPTVHLMEVPMTETMTQARQAFDDGRYADARDLLEAAIAALPADQEPAPEVRFLLAQSRLRTLNRNDPALQDAYQAALKSLTALIEDLTPADGSRPEPLWADVQAELGQQMVTAYRMEEAKVYLGSALDYWAGSTELESARPRYLELVLGLATRGERIDLNWQFPQFGERAWLENAVKLARTTDEKSRTNYLLAQWYERQNGDNLGKLRQGDLLKVVADLGSGPAHEAGLYALAEWYQRYGFLTYDEQGQTRFEPDFVQYLATLRRLVEQYPEGEGRMTRHAQQQIEQLTRPDLNVFVRHAFRPETEVSFNLSWRNLGDVKVEVFPTDLSRNGELAPTGPAVHSQIIRDQPERPHYAMNRTVRLPAELPLGAYMVVATAGELIRRDLLIVTDLTVVTKRDANKLYAFVADAETGAPVPGANLELRWGWANYRQQGETKMDQKPLTAVANAQGLAEWNIGALWENPPKDAHYVGWKLLARKDNRQAMVDASSYHRGRQGNTEGEPVYYFQPERPIYRPGETAKWRVISRDLLPDGSYRTPEERTVKFALMDADYETAYEGEAKLDRFGVLAGEFTLPADAPLGRYQLTVGIEGNRDSQQMIFRVEEFRAPEFKVGIEVGPQGGAGAQLEPGQKVSGEVQVDYYSGGAVGDAEVTVAISRSPYVYWFRPLYRFGWLHEMEDRGFHRGGESESVTQIELKTDSRGHASFAFETPQDIDQDWLYSVEVRVVDRSRREIMETRTLKLTRQPYFANVETSHRLYQPGDAVQATVTTVDANDKPVSVEGHLRLTRERWRQIYIHRRKGSEISGESWRQLPERTLIGATQSDYRLKEEGFVTEEIANLKLRTDASGKLVHRFDAPPVGYYNVQWISPGARGLSVTTDNAFWVAKPGDVTIGYRPGGVEIVVDQREILPGEQLPVLITVPTPNRSVWLVRGAEYIRDQQVLTLPGRAKMITLPITTADVPNVFLEASMISGGELFQNQVELVVPPTMQFLNVELQADADGYTPGSEAKLRLTVRDQGGNPVEGSFGLAMVDAALDSLVPEEQADIRQAFYADKRSYNVQTSSSLMNRPFYRPMEENGDVESDEELYALSPFEVVSESKAGYMATTTLAGTRLRSSLKDMPGAVSMVEDALATPTLREDFRYSAYWNPRVVTNAQGEAEVTVKLPDNLTEWRVAAVGIDAGSRVGQGELRTTTRLPLIARLAQPRFLYAGDAVVLSGVINNNTESVQHVRAELQVPATLRLDGPNYQMVSVPARDSVRVDWTATALATGEAPVRLVARSRDFADAMERPLAILEPRQPRQITWASRTEAEETEIALQLPDNLKAANPQVSFRVTPTVADSLLAALPYLVAYPYGCTEQTLSRFVPAVAVRKALLDLGFSAEQVQAALDQGGQADFVPLEAKTGLADLDAVIAASLKRLDESQLPDGSWPWMPGGSSDLYMTAYAVWTLTLAEQAGVALEVEHLDRARTWLEQRLIEVSDRPALQAWVLQALSVRHRTVVHNDEGQPTRFEARAFLNLFNQRDQLSAQTLAQLALSAKDYGFDNEAQTLVAMLRNSVKRDANPSQSVLLPVGRSQEGGDLPVAYWGQRGEWWNWYDGAEETTAWALMALLHVDPENALRDPAMHWLVRNRQATRWSNTRATATAVFALTDYLMIAGELDVAADWSLEINGRQVAQNQVGFDNLLTAQRAYEVPRELLQPGRNTLRLVRRGGEVPLYYQVTASYEAGPADFHAHGFQVFLQRQYRQITAVPTLLKGFREEIRPIAEPRLIKAGDRLEIVLQVEAKNNLEYLLIEDPKPAGLEMLAVLSGGGNVFARELNPNRLESQDDDERYTGRTAWVYQELRDRHTALLIPQLGTGLWEIRYRLRAETPGTFQALPARIEAMYVPPVQGGSDAAQFTIREEPTREE